jgi:hypothetical protein
MSNKQGIIIAGDKIHAGIDADDVTEIENCVVIHFENKEDMKEFLKQTKWFGQD